MTWLILSVNAGSSSLKVDLYELERSTLGQHHCHEPALVRLAHVSVSDQTTPPAKTLYRRGAKTVVTDQSSYHLSTSDDAFRWIIDTLVADRELRALSSRTDISHICHRIGHGGNMYSGSKILGRTLKELEKLDAQSRLLNESAISIIKFCQWNMPHVTNLAYFDTSFYSSLPLPIRSGVQLTKEHGLLKYGFHGLSYSFVTRAVASFIKKPADELNIIALHLGSSSSICAIKHGKPLDTSMGLTPLDELSSVHSTPVFYHAKHHAKVPAHEIVTAANPYALLTHEAEEMLNSRSGWRALTGTSHFNFIATSSLPACNLAFEWFVDRIIGYIGSYYTKLGGNVDALVFTGGIGEGSALLRQAVVDTCECLGFTLSQEKNEGTWLHGEAVVDIGEHFEDKRVLVCHTNEQYEMARELATQLLEQGPNNGRLGDLKLTGRNI